MCVHKFVVIAISYTVPARKIVGADCSQALEIDPKIMLLIKRQLKED
jgi:hypothetical protein